MRISDWSSDVCSSDLLCERERCPFAVVGTATAEERLVVGHGATAIPEPSLLLPAGEGARRADEGHLDQDRVVSEAHPIDLPLAVLFVKPPQMHSVHGRPRNPRVAKVANSTMSLPASDLRNDSSREHEPKHVYIS